MNTILCIQRTDDDLANIQYSIIREGWTLDVAEDADSARNALMSMAHSVVLWQLPATVSEAVALLREYRAQGGTAAMIAVADPAHVPYLVEILNAGLDEFVRTPIREREILLRLRALTDRPTVPSLAKNVLRFRDLELNEAAGTLLKSGTPIHLFRREFMLLNFLLHHPNQSFSSEALAQRVWRDKSDISTDTVRTHIKSLRKKIDSPNAPSLIKTERMRGYKLVS